MYRRYTVNSDQLGERVIHDPGGWDALDRTLNRNFDTMGVFRTITAELEFFQLADDQKDKDGYRYFRRLKNLGGTEAQATIKIERQIEGTDDLDIEFEGIAHMRFKVSYDDNLNPSLKLTFKESSFHTKFFSRQKTKVSIKDTESIDGVDLGALDQERIRLHQRDILEVNIFDVSSNNKFGNPGGGDFIDAEQGHVIPLAVVQSDGDNAQAPTDYLLSGQDLINNDSGLIYKFVNTPSTVTVKFDAAFTGIVEGIFSALIDISIDLVVYQNFDITDVKTSVPYWTLSGITGLVNIDDTISFESTFQLLEGEAFTIMFNNGAVDSFILYQLTWNQCDLETQGLQFFDETETDCTYRFEALERVVDSICDQKGSLVSSVFDRVDRVGSTVEENGKYHNNVVASGYEIRDIDSGVQASFDSMFNRSVKRVFNLGAGIEKIDRKYRVVVEELDYFFRGDVGLVIHNAKNIEIDDAEKFQFSEVKAGYKKAEYEEVNGLEEYNNSVGYANNISSHSNVLDLLSEERADGYGIEYARRLNKKFKAGTKDSKYDEHTFTIMTNPISPTLLGAEKDENFESVENIFSPETAYNLEITPSRNIKRNGDWIRGGVQEYLDRFLKITSQDKETDLITKKVGEDAIQEQTDFLQGDFINSLWLPFTIEFKWIATNEDFKALEANPYRLVKVSPIDKEVSKTYIYGWVLEAKTGGDNKEGVMKLLAANLRSARLIVKDPEGVTAGDEESDPPVILPGGFEYGFEFGLEG